MSLRITDETWLKAMEVLASTRHATAKLVYERTDRERKTLLARLERESNGKNQRERETYALTHPHYMALLERLDASEGEYYEARDERDSADAVIRVWQTLAADKRVVGSMR